MIVTIPAADQKSSSSGSVSTPPPFLKRYAGAGSKTVKFSSDEESGSDADNRNTNFRYCLEAWKEIFLYFVSEVAI